MLCRFAAAASLLVLFCAPLFAQDAASNAGLRYQTVVVEGMTTVRDLQNKHGKEGFEAILHVNRIDLEHLRQGSTVVVPERPASIADISPFPQSIGSNALPRNDVRRLRQADSSPQTGDPSFAGASDNAAWLLPWHVNFINASGVSFHQFALPGYPASHACVRLVEADARWIYEWAETWVLAGEGKRVEVYGTPVVVFGEYDFAKPGPWTRLASEPMATDVTLEEITRALDPHRETIAERVELRRAWQNRPTGF